MKEILIATSQDVVLRMRNLHIVEIEKDLLADAFGNNRVSAVEECQRG